MPSVSRATCVTCAEVDGDFPRSRPASGPGCRQCRRPRRCTHRRRTRPPPPPAPRRRMVTCAWAQRGGERVDQSAHHERLVGHDVDVHAARGQRLVDDRADGGDADARETVAQPRLRPGGRGHLPQAVDLRCAGERDRVDARLRQRRDSSPTAAASLADAIRTAPRSARGRRRRRGNPPAAGSAPRRTVGCRRAGRADRRRAARR